MEPSNYEEIFDKAEDAEKEEKLKELGKEGLFGIDYGSAYSCVSQWFGNNNPVEVIKFPKFKNSRFPSIISYLPKFNEWVIGDLAESCIEKYPQTSFVNLKRYIGENIVMLQEEEEVTSEDVLTNFFKILKKLVLELNPPKEMNGTVIAVPYSFYEYQRAAIINSARKATLPVLSLINEPEAIILSYCFEDRIEKYEELIMVIDMGEASLDIALFDVRQKKNYIVINCLNILGSPEIGGEDIDRIMLKHILEKHSINDGDVWQDIIINKKPIMGKLKHNLYELKQNLSIKQEESLLNFRLVPGLNLSHEITQSEFAEWIGSILSTTNEYLHKTLKEINVKPEQIDKVIVNGGSTRIASVKKIIEKFIGNQNKILYMNNDSMVSQGAAIYSAILKGKTERFGLNPINPYPIGIELSGGIFDDIIVKGRRLPCSDKKAYQINVAGATAFDINIYQGSGKNVEKNRPIALIEMPGLNPVKPDDYVVITINLDENCIGELKVEVENSRLSWVKKLSSE